MVYRHDLPNVFVAISQENLLAIYSLIADQVRGNCKGTSSRTLFTFYSSIAEAGRILESEMQLLDLPRPLPTIEDLDRQRDELWKHDQ